MTALALLLAAAWLLTGTAALIFAFVDAVKSAEEAETVLEDCGFWAVARLLAVAALGGPVTLLYLWGKR